MGLRERFPETSWTLLARACEQCDEGARAREDFAQRYYRPVQQFLFVLVQDAELAQDLAQEFFARLSEPGGLFERAHPEKGAFRNYLKKALRNLVTDYHRRNRNEALQTHPDQWSAGGWDVLDLPGLPAAEAAFHRAWVKATLAEALTRVRALCLKRKQEVHLHLFEARYLSEADPAPSWEELGARYGTDQKTARDRHPLRDLRHLARPPHHAQSRNHPRNGRGEGSACPRGSPRPRTLRSQYGPPADPRHHGTRARNPHPDRPRLQQSRDRHAAFRFRKHRQDTLCPRLRQARSRPPHPGRPARQRTRPPAVTASPESTISAPFLQNHPKV